MPDDAKTAATLAVIIIESEAEASDYLAEAETLWAAARIIRARHHLGLDDLDH